MKIILYILGITTDSNKRMSEHFTQNEKCAKYTKRHKAKKLEACFTSNNRSTASQLEYRIKELKKLDKENIINSKGTKILKDLLTGKIE